MCPGIAWTTEVYKFVRKTVERVTLVAAGVAMGIAGLEVAAAEETLLMSVLTYRQWSWRQYNISSAAG